MPKPRDSQAPRLDLYQQVTNQIIRFRCIERGAVSG